MTVLPHLAARLFGVPLAIHRPKLDVILSVLGARIGLADLAAPVGYTPAARALGPPSGKVAVIPIHGTLVRRTSGIEAESGLASYTGIAAQLDAALAAIFRPFPAGLMTGVGMVVADGPRDHVLQLLKEGKVRAREGQNE